MVENAQTLTLRYNLNSILSIPTADMNYQTLYLYVINQNSTLQNTRGSEGRRHVFLRDVNIWNALWIHHVHTFDCDF